MKLKTFASEYENLESVIYPSITFDNTANYINGSVYLDCNGVFKTIHIYYEGIIKINFNNHIGSRGFKVFENFSKKQISIVNFTKKKLDNNVLFEFNGYINKIKKALITGYGQRNSIGVKIIHGHNTDLLISQNKNIISSDSYVLEYKPNEYKGIERIGTRNDLSPSTRRSSARRKRNEKYYRASTKLPKTYKDLDSLEKCGNCIHILYPMSSNQTGICHLWKANVGLLFWCDKWKNKEGGN